MGVFGKLFGGKKYEQKQYWKNNPDEWEIAIVQDRVKRKLLEYALSTIETSTDVREIVSQKEAFMPILDWYVDMDAKGYPDGSGKIHEEKKAIIERYNIAVTNSRKLNEEEIQLAKGSLLSDSTIYNKCISALSVQESKGYFYGTAQDWINTAASLYQNNSSVRILDIYVACGMPKDIAYSKDAALIDDRKPFLKGSADSNLFNSYAYTVDRRYGLRYLPLMEVDKMRYGLNLPDDEIIYHRINVVTLHEEKRTRLNLTYSGVRWSYGVLRAGSYNVVGSDAINFSPTDIGRLFLTNKRILFIGAQRNVTKAIKIDAIIYYNLYKNGVIIHQANRKAILFEFDQTADVEIYDQPDGINEFVSVITRIIDHTEALSLPED